MTNHLVLLFPFSLALRGGGPGVYCMCMHINVQDSVLITGISITLILCESDIFIVEDADQVV